MFYFHDFLGGRGRKGIFDCLIGYMVMVEKYGDFLGCRAPLHQNNDGGAPGILVDLFDCKGEMSLDD